MLMSGWRAPAAAAASGHATRVAESTAPATPPTSPSPPRLPRRPRTLHATDTLPGPRGASAAQSWAFAEPGVRGSRWHRARASGRDDDGAGGHAAPAEPAVTENTGTLLGGIPASEATPCRRRREWPADAHGPRLDASQTPVEFFLKKQSVQRNAQHKTVCLFCKPRRRSPTWLRTCAGEPQVGNWEGRDGGLVSGAAWCQAEVAGAQGYWARIRLDRKAVFLRKIFKANISRITKSAR